MTETEVAFHAAAQETGIQKKDRRALYAFLAPLREKDAVTNAHYLHSIRVGLCARAIARFTGHDERALLMAGVLHDLGKCQVCLSTLGKSDDWTLEDANEIKRHVLDGYRILRGRFDLTAETIVRHHIFQPDGYPKRPPKFLHPYSTATRALILEHARIVSLADVYDALHRVNSRFGSCALSGKEIKHLMLTNNPDRVTLIVALYEAGIFTEHVTVH